MTGTGYLGPLGLAAGAVLACAVVTLWRRGPARGRRGPGRPGGRPRRHRRGARRALPRRRPGRHRRPRPGRQRVLIPALLRRVVRRDPGSRETAPLVNVPASLLAAAALIVVAYLASGKVTALAPGPPARLAPLGLATVLIGFFMLATRRKAVSRSPGCCWSTTGSRSSRSCSPPGAAAGGARGVAGRPARRRRPAGPGHHDARPPRSVRPRPAPGTARLMLIYAILAVPARRRRWPPPCRGAAGPAGRRRPPTAPSWSSASCSPPGSPAVSRWRRPAGSCGPTR